jgi:hypothetical protein
VIGKIRGKYRETQKIQRPGKYRNQEIIEQDEELRKIHKIKKKKINKARVKTSQSLKNIYIDNPLVFID